MRLPLFYLPSSKTSLFLLATLFGLANPISAQPSLWLTRQSQVDSVPILYPNLQAVGSLIIGYIPTQPGEQSDIYDLSPLTGIQKIYGDLYVRKNPRLKSLYGLHLVDTIFTGIHSEILENDSLPNLTGLDNVRFVGGFFNIKNNPLLQSTVGFGQLRGAERVTIEDNPLLQTLDLPNLERIYNYLILADNAVQTVHLPNFRRTGGLSISRELLTDMTGFAALDTIGRYFSTDGGRFWLWHNPALTTLAGLENMQFGPDLDVWIVGNAALSDVSVLATTMGDSLRAFWFSYNPSVASDLTLPVLRTAHVLKIAHNTGLKSIQIPNLEIVRYPGQNDTTMMVAYNDSLLHLDLPKLQQVGHRCWIKNNPQLLGLEGLGQLEVVGDDFEINYNHSLQNLAGLEQLRKVGGKFSVGPNENMIGLCDFVQFDTVVGVFGVGTNHLLEWKEGQVARWIGHRFSVAFENNLKSIEALTSIDSIGYGEGDFDGTKGFSVSNCLLFFSVNNFTETVSISPESQISIWNCDTIEMASFPNVQKIKALSFQGNPRLVELDFPDLVELGTTPFTYYKQLSIKNNPSLPTLDGFPKLAALQDSMVVRDNGALMDCDAICAMLDRGIPASRFGLGGNAFPCNLVADLVAACDSTTVAVEPQGPATKAALLTVPNPTNGVFFVQLPDGSTPSSLWVSDASGRSVLSINGGGADISALPNGLYFVRARDGEGRVWFGKIVKSEK